MTVPLKDLPPRLQDRYGYRPTSKILMAVAIVACIAIAGFGALVAYRLGSPEVYSKLLAWNAVAPTHTSITFELRRDPGITVQCALRVQNKQHHDLGYAIATIPPGTEYDQITYQVATNDLGYTAEVLDCAPSGQLSATEPQFPPGQTNPPQPWRPQ